MSSIQVKRVDPELHAQLRERAASAGCTLSEYVLELIRRDLRSPVRRQWLEDVARLPRHDVDRDQISALIGEGRSNR